jgi:hypothetical protein
MRLNIKLIDADGDYVIYLNDSIKYAYVSKSRMAKILTLADKHGLLGSQKALAEVCRAVSLNPELVKEPNA